MGNCCSSPGGAGSGAGGRQRIQHKKAERVARWTNTGIISLQRANLSDLPAEISQVHSPRVLDVSVNQLTRLPPSVPLTLHRLVLSDNRIESVAGLELIKNLKVLVLDSNRISQLPSSLGALTKLETLSASNNQLASLPASLGSLQKLRQLALSQNQLRQLPEELGNCSSLEELDVRQNKLQVLPASLGRLQRLKVLQCDSNQLRAIPPPILRDCAALATLSLHDNPITPEKLQETEGYAEYESRRQGKYTKVLAGGALLGNRGMDDGFSPRGK